VTPIEDQRLYLIHLFLFPFVDPEAIWPGEELAAWLDVDPGQDVELVSKALLWFEGREFQAHTRYLNAELSRLRGDLAGYCSQLMAILEPREIGLPAACSAVSLSRFVVHQLRTFRNHNTATAALPLALQLVFGHPVPEPDYTDRQGRKVYARLLLNQNDEPSPIRSVYAKAIATSAQWLGLAARCPEYRPAGRVREALRKPPGLDTTPSSS
jgi:hypothetical protein